MSLEVTVWDKKPITEPGLYSEIPIETYHEQLTEGVSVSSGVLRTTFYQSPAHAYVDSYLNPDRQPRVVSEAMILGQAAHHIHLGEAHFGRHFIVRPETYPSKEGPKPWHGGSNYCREWLAAQSEAKLTVVTPEQIVKIRAMAKTLAAHPLIQAGVLNGLIEHSMVWQDQETGLWLKSRPDAIPTDSADFSDLKTIADITDDGIARAIYEHGYHMQGALIREGAREVLGMEMESFSLVFIESKLPFCARVKTLKPADLDLGERQNRTALRLLARCVERNEWPGPGGVQSDADYTEIPDWGRKNIEYRLAQMETEPEI